MSDLRHFPDVLRKAHLGAGVSTLILFVLTGQYMQWVHGHLEGMADGPRLFFRSAHIYLLWSGIANALLGCYLMRLRSAIYRSLQTVFSVLVLASAPMLAYSFFCEPYNAELLRPVGWWANVLAFIGAIGQVCVSVRSDRMVLRDSASDR